MMQNYSFAISTKISYGPYVYKEIENIADQLGCKKALLVTDKNLVRFGVAGKVAKQLKKRGVLVEVFDNVDSNPSDENVHAGATILSNTSCDLIVAVGGGSVMDCAKCIGVMSVNPGRINDYESPTAKFPKKNPHPLITLPTTSGTGAEIIGWAVITDSTRSYKMSIGSPYLEPDFALVDPVLTIDLPPRQTAESGMDALSQSIEGIISRRRSPISRELGLLAVKLISENLLTATHRGWDLEARANMSLGSLLGGMVMVLSECIAVHSLAETLGGFYRLPHGLTVGLILPHILKFNLNGDLPLYAEIARALGADTSCMSIREAAGQVIPRIKQLLNDLDFPSLKEVGLKEEDIPELATLAMNNPSTPNNPRQITMKDFETILKDALVDDPQL